jgi:phospholipid/cholesterol/gamma-HCH transport system substrate-binding protein
VKRAGAFVLLMGLLVLTTLTACGRSHDIAVKARFTDVGDLAPEAPVMMGDVTVGKVTGISLDGHLALVSMSLDREADVPRDITARVRRTSLLGERIVDLVPAAGLAASAPALRDGDTIRYTQVRADIEDLVKVGTTVLAPISASEVATLVDEGAKGFGGNGEQLGGLIDNFHQIVHAYSGRTDQIQSLITSLNKLNTTLAPHSDAQAKSLRNTARALDVLREESGRLKKALHALARLSVGSRSILDAHADEMSRFFSQMRVILGVLQSEHASITGLLKWAQTHNRNTQLVDYQTFNQVLQDFVICGFNNDQSDPARRCKES